MKNIVLSAAAVFVLSACSANQELAQAQTAPESTAQTLSAEDRKKAKQDDRGHRAMPMTASRLANLLETYNTDADEIVTWDEYNTWRQNRFNETDTNNNGTVDEEEYVYEFENRLDERYEKGRKAHIKQTHQRFDALDKNDNGAIAWAEYQASGERIFAKWDTNQDGTINADDPNPEYGKKKKSNDWWNSKNPLKFVRMPTTHDRKGVMDIYDANEDGAVTKAEFDNERKSVFRVTDQNKNGELNSEEYLAEFEDRIDRTINTSRRGQIKQTYVRFGILDDNKDEKMTFAEMQISGKRIFTRWDKNEDGVISKADIGV